MITLTKVDPERNMKRYYRVMVQTTTLGEWCLVRAYGRIGRSERVMPPVVCVDEAAAVTAAARLVARKKRRGYIENGRTGV